MKPRSQGNRHIVEFFGYCIKCKLIFHLLNLQMLPLNTNIRLAYSNGKDDEQNFIQNLSLFLCTFLKEHGQLIEKRLNLRETLMEVGLLEYLSPENVSSLKTVQNMCFLNLICTFFIFNDFLFFCAL